MKYKRTFQWAEFIFALYVWTIIIYFLLFIVPMLESVLKGFTGEFPLSVILIIHMSHFMKSFWPAVIFIGLSILMGLHFWRLHHKAIARGKITILFDRIIPACIILFGIFLLIFILWNLKLPKFTLEDFIHKR